MFRRSKKCHFCGSKENLSQCSCGKQFCPVHGVGGSCIQCYSTGLVRIPETTTRIEGAATPKKTPTPRPREAARGLRTELSYSALSRGGLMEGLSKIIRGHHFLCFAQRRVAMLDKGREIEVLYHGDRILNTLTPDESEMTMLTDVRRISAKSFATLEGHLSDMGSYLAKVHASSRYDLYKALVHHNEFSWLLQTIVLAMGADVRRAKMDWKLVELPVRRYGPLCPWCGSAAVAQRGGCTSCGRAVPEEVEAGQFISSHLKRQLTDKLISLRMLYQEGEMSPSDYRSRRDRLLALKGAVERVRWTGDQAV